MKTLLAALFYPTVMGVVSVPLTFLYGSIVQRYPICTITAGVVAVECPLLLLEVTSDSS